MGRVPEIGAFRKTKAQPNLMRTLLLANIFYWACAGVFTPFLSSYFTRQGLDASQIGIVFTMVPLCSIFVQPLWSAFADRIGGRKIVLVCLCLAAAAVAPLFNFSSTFIAALLATLAFSAFFQALLPVCDSLVIEAAARGGLEFSRIRMGGTIGYAVVVVVAGYALEAWPSVQFVMVPVILLVFAMRCARLPQPWKEARPGVRPSETRKTRGHGFRSIFTTDEIVIVLSFVFVSSVGLGFHGSFLGRYCIELGNGQDLVGILSAVSAMSEIPILIVSDRLICHIGEVHLLLFSCFAMALRLLLVSTGIVPVMIAAQLLQSVSYMTVYYSAVTYIAKHTLPGAQARGQSVLVMVQAGFATVIANLIGGFLCDAFGTGVSFVIFAGITTAGTFVVIALMGVHRKKALARTSR